MVFVRDAVVDRIVKLADAVYVLKRREYDTTAGAVGCRFRRLVKLFSVNPPFPAHPVALVPILHTRRPRCTHTRPL